jgi:3-phenylpropionate/cinnamic acid dioxygenase small subunit
MNAPITAAEAADLLYREGHCLDTQRWDDWLALYCADAVFWVPAWNGPHELVDAPDTQVSLMYYTARAGLEDRVWRIRSGLSTASCPLRRTSHGVSCVIIAGESPEGVEVHASWTCHVFDPRQQAQHVFFGRYEHRLRREGAVWKIARKKIVLMNDRIPTLLDFYCI